MRVADAALPARAVLAMAAPGLCAAHCLAAPALMVVAPAIAESPPVELGLTALSLAAGVGVVRAGVRAHKQPRIWIPVLVGMLLFLARWALGLDERPEEVVTVLGSLALLVAIGWDFRLRRCCACEGCGCAPAVAPDTVRSRRVESIDSPSTRDT